MIEDKKIVFNIHLQAENATKRLCDIYVGNISTHSFVAHHQIHFPFSHKQHTQIATISFADIKSDDFFFIRIKTAPIVNVMKIIAMKRLAMYKFLQ